MFHNRVAFAHGGGGECVDNTTVIGLWCHIVGSMIHLCKVVEDVGEGSGIDIGGSLTLAIIEVGTLDWLDGLNGGNKIDD